MYIVLNYLADPSTFDCIFHLASASLSFNGFTAQAITQTAYLVKVLLQTLCAKVHLLALTILELPWIDSPIY